MQTQKYYMLEFTRYNYEFEYVEHFFFKDECSAIQYVTTYMNHHECRSVSIDWEIIELTFDELKEEITVKEFEELFDILIGEVI